MLKTNQSMPIVGVVFVSSHWNRSKDSPNIIVEVDNERPDEGPAFSGELPVPSAAAFALSERTAALLRKRGLTSEFGRTWPRTDAPWEAMLARHADAPFPLIHVSIPARFGKNLVRRVAKALQPLREEGILLEGASAAFADATRHDAERHEALPSRMLIDEVEGVPV